MIIIIIIIIMIIKIMIIIIIIMMIITVIILLYFIEKTVLLILRGCLASLKALALREVLRGLACAGFFWIACAGSLARMLSHYNSIIF